MRTHVGFLSENRSELVESYFAVSKIGGVFVPLSTRDKIDQIIDYVNLSDIRFLFVSGTYIDACLNLRDHMPRVEQIIALDHTKNTGVINYQRLLATCVGKGYVADMAEKDTNIRVFSRDEAGCIETDSISCGEIFRIVERTHKFGRQRSDARVAVFAKPAILWKIWLAS